MGCVYSGPATGLFRRSMRTSNAADNHDGHTRRMFRVANIDDRGQEMNVGDIEVTSSDLLLHQKGRTPICWPLR